MELESNKRCRYTSFRSVAWLEVNLLQTELEFTVSDMLHDDANILSQSILYKLKK